MGASGVASGVLAAMCSQIHYHGPAPLLVRLRELHLDVSRPRGKLHLTHKRKLSARPFRWSLLAMFSIELSPARFTGSFITGPLLATSRSP